MVICSTLTAARRALHPQLRITVLVPYRTTPYPRGAPMSPRPQPGSEYVLTVSCQDKPGLVFAVSSFLVQHSGNIRQSQQFDDRRNDAFFMRVHFDEIGRASCRERV